MEFTEQCRALEDLKPGSSTSLPLPCSSSLPKDIISFEQTAFYDSAGYLQKITLRKVYVYDKTKLTLQVFRNNFLLADINVKQCVIKDEENNSM